MGHGVRNADVFESAGRDLVVVGDIALATETINRVVR